MVGLDTGYFIGMIRGDGRIIEHWEGLRAREVASCVSVLSLGEILYLAIRMGKPKVGSLMAEGISKTSTVVNVDRQVVERAAALKGGRGIPYVDALIIASLALAGCNEIHTRDRGHFADVKIKGTKMVVWG